MKSDKATYQKMYEEYKAQADIFQARLNNLKQEEKEVSQKALNGLYGALEAYEKLRDLAISIDRCKDILGDLNWAIRCLRDRYGVVIRL